MSLRTINFICTIALEHKNYLDSAFLDPKPVSLSIGFGNSAKASAPLVAGIAVAAAALGSRSLIRAWQAFKARPVIPRARKFYPGGFQHEMTRREAALILGVRRARLGTPHPGIESPLLRPCLFSGAKQVWARCRWVASLGSAEGLVTPHNVLIGVTTDRYPRSIKFDGILVLQFLTSSHATFEIVLANNAPNE
ncbi:Mitochondrial import inner membrane translocase subunit TIM14-1 [Dendrobium catenatum]|uniref:Mitochondrial import inner membrane translocase subunit TIM14-1 n=1 Tax=Dendrobium catenatum TaxID=906689 RepID=A0A2I0WKR1_9ASPA|nr:Mitochondrial import inner membrane translocase subunit TIM14-1 [Dendrobium catenatum]